MNPTLFSALLIIVLACVIIFGWARLRPREVGLSTRGLVVGAMTMVGCWLVAQLLLVAAAAFAGDPLVPAGRVGERFTEVIAQALGTAPNEELVFRGFLFVQLVLIARRFTTVRAAWSIGALAAAIIFALGHLPQRWTNQDLHGTALVQDLVQLGWNGLMLTLVYVRTGYLEVGIGFHALWNEPWPLVASPLGAGTANMITQVAVILAWPYLRWPRAREGRAG